MRALLLAGSVLGLTLSTTPAYAAPDSAVVALAPVPDGKLTDAARPLAYRIDLTADPAKDRFSGHVEIDAELKAPSRFIDLHGRDLAMKHAVVRVDGREIAGSWTQLDDTGVARLTFPETLPAGKLTLAFDYAAAFGNGPSTLFRAQVSKEWYAWSQFESIDARGVFPGFDEPGFKVPFTVTLRAPAGLKAVSNAPEISVTREGGLEVHRFAPTLPLPTYLVALMVGPFATAEGKVPPTPQRAAPLPVRVVSPQPNADRLGFALEGTKGIVQLLEGYFDEPFPFPKLDQVSSPVQSGAMENAGADLYNDSYLIVAEGSPISAQRTFGMVVAHELAHQWFGDLVTPAWWDDIWLNESFANWMGYRIGGAWRPDLNIGAGATLEGFQAMDTDALVVGRPIHQSIVHNSQIDAAFDSITYGKGGHVVAMIAAYMGDEKFRAGVRRYMAAHRYGNATSADFFRAMAEEAGDPRILPAMQSFTDQQGVPLITFSGSNGNYTMRQSRYAKYGAAAPLTRWGIPVCVRRGSERDCSLLTEAEGQIAIKGAGPLVPNAGGTGYYRFELPSADWDALIAAADTLPGGEAIALADSLRASYEAGRSKPGQLAALARKLIDNPDSYASALTLAGLDKLDGRGFLDRSAAKSYRAFVRSLYVPKLAKLGFDPKTRAYAAEDAERAQQRIQFVSALAETARDAKLRARLATAADAYLAGDKQALDPAYLRLGLSAWVDRQGLSGAKRLFDQALSSEDPLFRPFALDVVASTGKKDVGAWVLTGATDPRLRQKERYDMIRGVIGSGGTRELGFAWMKGNFDAFVAGAGGIFQVAKLPDVLGGFCSASRADEIAAILRPRFKGTTAELSLERTIERVRSCGTLRQARAAETSRAIRALK